VNGHCRQPECTATYGAHKWGKIRAHSEGWFFPDDAEPGGWCPDHLPEWVPDWRARKSAARG
jgi:hypothetical protein